MPRIHPTAIIESNVQLGEGTSVWDNAHIRHDAVLGEQCLVGGKSTIAYDVKIGNRVKINSNAYICNGVTIEDDSTAAMPSSTTPRVTFAEDSGDGTSQSFVRKKYQDYVDVLHRRTPQKTAI